MRSHPAVSVARTAADRIAPRHRPGARGLSWRPRSAWCPVGYQRSAGWRLPSAWRSAIMRHRPHQDPPGDASEKPPRIARWLHDVLAALHPDEPTRCPTCWRSLAGHMTPVPRLPPRQVHPERRRGRTRGVAASPSSRISEPSAAYLIFANDSMVCSSIMFNV